MNSSELPGTRPGAAPAAVKRTLPRSMRIAQRALDSWRSLPAWWCEDHRLRTIIRNSIRFQTSLGKQAPFRRWWAETAYGSAQPAQQHDQNFHHGLRTEVFTAPR